MGQNAADILVIGGGTAGCVLASRLASNPDLRILVLEAGPAYRHPALAIPGAFPWAMTSPRYNWLDSTEAEPALDGRRLFLAQARIAGGGSSINGLVYARGPDADYDDWGVPGWGSADLAPVFAVLERDFWRPLRGSSPLPVARGFLDAIAEAGLPRAEGLGASGEGFGFYDWTVQGGRRISGANLLAGRPNIALQTGARVLRLIIEAGRVRGCAYLQDGQLREARAERVVLCAGALRSPQLLMLSGIGPAEHLRAQGINVAHDLPGVGRNLVNHVSWKLQYTTEKPVSAYRYLNPLRGAVEAARYMAGRGGYLSLAPTPVGGFFRSRAELSRPDMQAFMSPALSGSAGLGLRRLLPDRHGFAVFMNQGRPDSRGVVELASADPLAAPRIVPRYFSAPGDLETLLDAAERLRGLGSSRAYASMGAREVSPGPEVQGRAGLEAHIRANATNHYHVAGTCRMGEDADAVVDPTLKLRGLEGLWVADNAVMPTMINGNTAAPAAMIGARCAHFLLSH